MSNVRRLVICNPQARASRRRSAAEYLRALLRARGLSGEVEQAASWEEAQRLAQQAAAAAYDQVVAAGGDGTVNAVANGLAGSQTALGVLPLGTGNILAYNLGLARLPQALAALQGDRRLTLDLGRIGNRYFVAVAGVGFDAEVARNLDPLRKQRMGRMAFLAEGLVLRHRAKPHFFRLEMQGETQEVLEGEFWSAFFSNFSQHTWNLPLTRQANPADGWLDLMLFRDTPTWDFFFGLGHALLWHRDLKQVPGVTVHRVQAVRIVTTPPWIWEADGDVCGETPVEVEVCPQALQVLTSAT